MVYSISDYADLKRSVSTQKGARYCLSQYFLFLNNGVSLSNQDLDNLSLQYLQNSDTESIFSDVSSYLESILSYAPKTISYKINFVLHWLKINGVVFSEIQLSLITSRMPRIVAIHDEDYLDLSKLKAILAHGDTLFRAVVLVLASSGMRIGECCLFEFSQIRGNEIHMRADQMKAGRPHVYFISSEAVAALAEWMKVRDAYIAKASARTTKCLRLNCSKSVAVFPFSYNVILAKFRLSLQKSGLHEMDPVTKRGRLTPHSIRKWTDSTMKMYISSNLANALIGHYEPGDSSYRRYTREQLREAYAKVEPYLTIMAPQEYAELKSETQQQLASHDKLIVSLVEQNQETKKELEVLKSILQALR
ncbi:MAG: tyrosine-type recombinase/integrase [Methanocorpusculum sp.]|nr:tyrosine-type recombinase/integrase [Methanocorpusculum sp.]